VYFSLAPQKLFHPSPLHTQTHHFAHILVMDHQYFHAHNIALDMLGSLRIDMAVIINTTSNKIETPYYTLVHMDTTIFLSNIAFQILLHHKYCISSSTTTTYA
jgi:hypothetical protein